MDYVSESVLPTRRSQTVGMSGRIAVPKGRVYLGGKPQVSDAPSGAQLGAMGAESGSVPVRDPHLTQIGNALASCGRCPSVANGRFRLPWGHHPHGVRQVSANTLVRRS